MSLHRLLFDPSNAAESANIGSYLRLGQSGALATYHSKTQASLGSFVFVDADVTPASDTIAESAHGYETGALVRLTTSGTLPAGLATATDYYVIRVDANTIKLASSLANAEAGIAVDITAAAGGGNHTLTSQEQQIRAIDVNMVNTLDISATNLDIRDLSHTQDSIKIGDGTDFLAIASDGSIAITDNGGSLTVDASDLDIRDLSFATDSVDVSGSSVSISGTVAVTQSTSPWVVSASDLDIRDLSHTQDSVKIGDGTDFLAIASDGSIAITDNGGSLTVDAVNLDIRDLAFATDSVDVSGSSVSISGSVTVTATDLDVRDLAFATDKVDVSGSSVNITHNTAISNAAESVSTSAALVTSVLSNRENIMIYNNGSKAVFIGASGVSSSNGFPLYPGFMLEAAIGPSVAIHAVAQSGTQDVRILQMS